MKRYTPLLLDLRGLVMNAFHAGMSMEPLQGEVKAEVNTAEHGFNNFLTKFFDPMLDIVDSPLHMVAVIDDGNTYRQTLFPKYKGARPDAQAKKDPVELEQEAQCLQHVKNFLAALGIPSVKLKGQEADDVIAYMVEKLHPYGPVTVATIDKDLLQLYPKAGIFRNGKLLTEYLPNVPCELVGLYASIVGKGSDFPGVVGMGEKAWDSLVDDYGIDGMHELKALVDARDNGKLRKIADLGHNKALKNLAAKWDEWHTQYKVATLCPSLCEGAKVKLDWYKRCPTEGRLYDALKKAGSLDLMGQYRKHCFTATLVTRDNLQEVMTSLPKLLAETPAVPWDFETTDKVQNPKHKEAIKDKKKGRNYVDVMNSEITGCSFGFGANMQHTYYFSVDHKDTPNVDKQVILDVLNLVESRGVDTVAHNIAFESSVAKIQLGHEMRSYEDTRCYSHHINENTTNGLKYLSKHYLNYNQTTYAELLAEFGAANMSELTGEQTLDYGADDSMVTGQLYAFFTLLTRLEDTYNFVYTYECPAIAPIKDSYIKGIQMDAEEIARQHKADLETMEKSYARVTAMLEEHCSEPRYTGVDRLFEDQKSYITYKTIRANKAKAKAESDALVKAALANYKDSLKATCVYIKPYEVPAFDEFIPTPTQLTKVAKILELPPFEKNSKVYITDWLQELYYHSDTLDSAEEGLKAKRGEWLNLLPAAVSGFSKRDGEAYEAFKAVCNRLIASVTPPKIMGTVLNLGSQKHMTALLYMLLDFPIRMRAKVQPDSLRREAGLPGSPSVSESAIDFALANDCGEDFEWKAELLREIDRYNKASTRCSNYWKAYPLWMDDNGIIHASFLMPGTKTRRPTGSNPNMLQVSQGEVRKTVRPRKPGNVIVSVDFASQELRVLASVTGDKNFLSAYIHPADQPDKDLHTMTGCGVAPVLAKRKKGDLLAQLKLDEEGKVEYEWYLEMLSRVSAVGKDVVDGIERGFMSIAKFLKDVRGVSKIINFGAGYGATASTVSIQAMIPIEDAELAVDGMMATYPGINIWKAKVFKFAKEMGYVATTYGSRRHCGNALTTGSRSEVGRWERQLANYLIQGQCGDLLKVVLTGARDTRLFERLDAYLLAPIYDELLAEVPGENVYTYLHELADLMEINMPNIIVPMVADCSFGPTWYEQTELGVRPSRERVNAELVKIFGEVQ